VGVGEGRPGAHRGDAAAFAALRQRSDDDGQHSEFFRRGLALDDPQERGS
jgi:hypothetical protein